MGFHSDKPEPASTPQDSLKSFILTHFHNPMYPNAQEQAALNAAENLMNSTMARYDPSHDVFHGQ